MHRRSSRFAAFLGAAEYLLGMEQAAVGRELPSVSEETALRR
jgi:hypothetical protein